MADERQRPPGPPKLLGRAAGSRLIDLARSAMVTRHRDLDAFAYADANDVSLIDDSAACISSVRLTAAATFSAGDAVWLLDFEKRCADQLRRDHLPL